MRKSVKRQYEQDRKYDYFEIWRHPKGRKFAKRQLHKRLRKLQLKYLESGEDRSE